MNILRCDYVSMHQSQNFIKGQVCYAVDTQRFYIWDGSVWVLFPTIDEIDDTSSHPTNCINCGAVLNSCRCEYCGTEYFD